MRDIAEYALQAALDAGAAYADVRVQEVDTEEVSVRNGVLETAEQSTTAALGLRRERTVFVSSEGSLLTQTILQTGTGISATAADDHDAQHRSYPGGHGGQHACAGFELVRDLALVQSAPQIAEEALAL